MPEQNHPLSFAQQRLWFLDQLAPGTAFYNIPLVLDLDGPLEAATLERALGEIVRRHEPLRTIFPTHDGRPRQEVSSYHPFTLPVEDLADHGQAEREAAVDRRILEEIRRPFDLKTGPVFRATLVRLDAARHVLVAAVHHISFDGWSSGVFFRELAALYDAFSTGAPSPLPELPLRYVDFAGRQREWLTGDTFARQMAYWKDQLRPPRPLLSLPADRPRPAVQTYRGQRDHAMLPEPLVGALQELSRREGVTMFMTMLAAYTTLLHRLTGQADVLIGTPIANRTRQDIEPLIGFFVNSLALRMDASGEPTFRRLLAQARRVAVGAYANQDLPFERIVEELNPERSLSHSPILQTFLVLDNTPNAVGDSLAAGPIIIRRRRVTTNTSKVDVTLVVRRAETGQRVSLESSADLFDASTGSRLLRAYVRLLESIVENPERPIDRLRLLTDEDRRQVTVDWNQTARPFPGATTVAALFEEQVTRTPDLDAVVCGTEQLTYAELNARANTLAREIRARGVGPDDRVAICLDRTPSLVIAVLAILKAGAAYVPLDPLYPPDRLAFIVNDAECRLVVTEPTLAANVSGEARELLFIDRHRAAENSASATNLVPAPGPDDLAYVIYTSGSTGRPKGVAIEHRSVANLIAWALDTFSRDELSGMLASTSLSFDLSVFELFVPLCSGGTAILVDHLLALPDAPARARVTFINSVPSVMAELLRIAALPSGVGVVALAGEVLHPALVDRLYEQGSVRKVFDLYGPTETTVYATCALRRRGSPSTIGHPIANTTAFVLDPSQQPMPVGVAGELYLGGAGVARGYLRRPDLTGERFVSDPLRDASVARAYRTGDLVRWRPDGSLEFLGRLDRQVKIRGFRVELGEIESTLTEHPAIRDAVVVTGEDARGDIRLVGFVVEGQPCENDELYQHLEQRLPHYMIPSAMVRLHQLPRLPNGKIDHAELSARGASLSAFDRPSIVTPSQLGGCVADAGDAFPAAVPDSAGRLAAPAGRLARPDARPDVRPDVRPDATPGFHDGSLRAPGPSPTPAAPASPLSADMRRQLLDEWAGQAAPYPRDQTIPQLFEALAIRSPRAQALVSMDATWTYGEVNARANQLARHLRSRLADTSARRTVNGDEPIGVCLDRSLDTIVVLLAILKAGRAYVPLDPTHPPARLAALARRVGLGLVVTRAELAERASATGADGVDIIRIDTERDAIAAEDVADLSGTLDAASLAYVLFTSGTTGQPKAVAVPHRAVVRLVYGLPDVPLGDGQTVLHMASLAFDASTFEIWGPLLHGGRVAVAPDRLLTSRSLQEFLVAHRVTVMWLTAPLFNAVVDERPEILASVKQLLIGGEALSVPHVEKAIAALPETRILNGYGPTETTTFACCYPIAASRAPGARSIPIGRPLANTRVYVLGPERELLPAGEPGELWIGGDGVARGYLDDEELTRLRFVRDPFVEDAYARMYGTGDRVRFLPDGTLEFLARFDDQVKIRGFRIEPAEIEAVLVQHPLVSQAAVAAVERPAIGRSLFAFIVPAASASRGQREALVSRELRAFLTERLPDYMVPSQWIALETLPLLTTGKIDRSALVSLADRQEIRAPKLIVSPRSHTETAIAEIWRAVLGVADVSVDDDFFQSGGHSLLATQLLSRIQNRFEVDIDLRALFAAPTVAGLAKAVEAAGAARTAPIPTASRETDLPLSFAQQRLWFMERWHGDSGVYNVPTALRLIGALDVNALERALQTLIDRHEALRTVFPLRGGRGVQRVLDDVTLAMPATDLSHLPAGDAEVAALNLVRQDARLAFDLGTGPLFRATLVRLSHSTHFLLLTLHHIVADGWSLDVLFREVEALYIAYLNGGLSSPLRPLLIQYPDFAVWQRQYLQGEILERHLTYWRQQLRPPLAVLDLPLDRPRPPETTATGGHVSFTLPQQLVSALTRFSASENVTLFMTLLAAFLVVLHRYSGQDDVCVGTPVANRTRPEIEGLIGCFVNTLVIRGDLSKNPTFRRVVQHTRRTAIDAQVHQAMPFELLVDALNVERSPVHSPLFQAMFTLQEGLSDRLELPGLSISRVPVDVDYAKFEVSLSLRPSAEGMRGIVGYNADLFEPQTAARLGADFRIALEAGLADPDRRLSDLTLVGANPRRRRPVPFDAVAAGSPSSQRSPHRSPPRTLPRTSPKTTASLTPIEAALVEVWRRVLEVPDVAISDNFFDLGGNSLLAIRLFSEIEEHFGVKLRLSTLFRHGRIDAQARLLSADAIADTGSPLVPIQPLGSEPPLFLVHGIGGEVISFQALARRVGALQPIYGLQADGRDGVNAVASIEQIAERYVDAIRRMSPAGPYRVGGYSAGGVIAYEMAQQLRHAGEDVTLLVLDAYAPGTRKTRMSAGAIWRRVKNAAYWPVDDEFLRSGWTAQRARVRAKIHALRARRRRPLGDESSVDVRDLLGLWNVPAHSRAYLENYVRMMGAYRAREYAGAVTVLRSRTLSLGFRGTPDLGWNRLARGGVTLHVVPGAHDTILKEPRVQRLAAVLVGSLNSSAGGASARPARL